MIKHNISVGDKAVVRSCLAYNNRCFGKIVVVTELLHSCRLIRAKFSDGSGCCVFRPGNLELIAAKDERQKHPRSSLLTLVTTANIHILKQRIITLICGIFIDPRSVIDIVATYIRFYVLRILYCVYCVYCTAYIRFHVLRIFASMYRRTTRNKDDQRQWDEFSFGEKLQLLIDLGIIDVDDTPRALLDRLKSG